MGGYLSRPLFLHPPPSKYLVLLIGYNRVLKNNKYCGYMATGVGKIAKFEGASTTADPIKYTWKIMVNT